MKTIIRFVLTVALLCTALVKQVRAQSSDAADSTGLPGDSFSLEGALELFKKAGSPEEFEKELNSESNYVNNLDLDGNGETDYVSVTDLSEADVHAFVLRVGVDEKESQDVAVIELEKNGESSAVLQIIGDEELYGEELIVEPIGEEAVEPAPKGRGPLMPEVSIRPVVVNVWLWPCVRFAYAPAYVVWVSPWHRGHYPTWWRPWRPHPWRWHWNHCAPYRAHHHVVYTHRVIHAHRVYRPHRMYSARVHAAHVGARSNYQQRNQHRADPAGRSHQPAKSGGGGQKMKDGKGSGRNAPAKGGNKGRGGRK